MLEDGPLAARTRRECAATDRTLFTDPGRSIDLGTRFAVRVRPAVVVAVVVVTRGVTVALLARRVAFVIIVEMILDRLFDASVLVEDVLGALVRVVPDLPAEVLVLDHQCENFSAAPLREFQVTVLVAFDGVIVQVGRTATAALLRHEDGVGIGEVPVGDHASAATEADALDLVGTGDTGEGGTTDRGSTRDLHHVSTTEEIRTV
jgi:hypothetical protein